MSELRGLSTWLCLACAGYYLVAGLAICIGYHRVLSHRSAVLSKWLERLLVTLGLPAGTPIQWAGNHRFHHAHADQPGDPHSPRDGFWHAHNGWYIGRKDAFLRAYALAGPLRILFDGVHRPRSNQQHVHLAPDVAADPGTGSSAAPARTWPSRSRTSRSSSAARSGCSGGPASRRSG